MAENKELSLRELQLVELNVLEKFDAFCAEHNINYTLVGGTLLGAVRHKGFIPWDDDVDVGMPRPDYERFYELLKDNNFVLPSFPNIILIPDRGAEGKLPFLKLVDTDYSINSSEAVGSDNVWIDIIPIDGYPDTLKQTKKYCKKLKWYRRIIVYNISSYKRKKGFMRIVAALFSVYAHMYGKARAQKKMQRLIAKYPYDSSEFVGCATWGMYGVGERIKKSGLEQCVKLQFENDTLSAMSNWDEYLTGIYGDYMTPRKWSHGMSASGVDDAAAEASSQDE